MGVTMHATRARCFFNHMGRAYYDTADNIYRKEVLLHLMLASLHLLRCRLARLYGRASLPAMATVLLRKAGSDKQLAATGSVLCYRATKLAWLCMALGAQKAKADQTAVCAWTTRVENSPLISLL